MKIKSKLGKSIIGAVLVVGGVVGFSQSASALSQQNIASLNSPNGYGYTWGSLDWRDSSTLDVDLEVTDKASDGHGPYGHVIISADNYAGQVSKAHATGGVGSDAMFSPTRVSGHGKILYADVWTCNGGDANGNGTVEGGCYGRRYFNPYGRSPQPSDTLGYYNGIY